MSKVKQPLEDAKEFASSEDNGEKSSEVVAVVKSSEVVAVVTNKEEVSEEEKNRQEFLVKKNQTVLVDENKEGVVYKSQQALHNWDLKKKVTKAQEAFVELCEANIQKVNEIKQYAEQQAVPRHTAIQEFHRDFMLETIAAVAPNKVKEDLQLKFSSDSALAYAEKTADMAELAVKAPSILFAPTDSKAGKGRGIYFDSIKPLSDILLHDETLTLEVLQPLKVAANTDVFRELRALLSSKQEELDLLKLDIQRCEELKANATIAEDVVALEDSSLRQITISEQLIARVQERLNDIFASNVVIEQYRQNYETLRETSEESLTNHAASLNDELSAVSADLEAVAVERQERIKTNLSQEAEYTSWLKASDEKLRAKNRQQKEAWQQILILVEQMVELAKEQETEVQQQVDKAEKESRRKIDADSFLTGLENYSQILEQAKEFITTGQSWVSTLKNFTNQMFTEIEKKKVEEELMEYRLSEQLGYLEVYRSFKKHTDELVNKKESRLVSLGRLNRNLDLQIKEATNTLDPNKKAYQDEVGQVGKQVEEISKSVEALKVRSEKQSKMWKPTEEQLEDANVDFDPPDIAAEKQRCERKAQTLSVARNFVYKEQETVDKEQLTLRKLKTNNQVAIEDNSRRREEQKQIASSASPEKIEAAPPT